MKYKVGDKVEIAFKKCGHRFSIGETVTIITAREEVGDYEAINTKNGESWYIRDSEIKGFNETKSTSVDNPYDNRREYFAAMAMQGLLADYKTVEKIKESAVEYDVEEAVARMACIFTDALIEELNKKA